LKKCSIRLDVDSVSKSRTKAYVNTDLFKDYIKSVFLLNLNELRSEQKIGDQEAVLLMDNCPSHVSDKILVFLSQAYVHVIIITFTLHMMHNAHLPSP
jgi:hypothetical protein